MEFSDGQFTASDLRLQWVFGSVDWSDPDKMWRKVVGIFRNHGDVSLVFSKRIANPPYPGNYLLVNAEEIAPVIHGEITTSFTHDNLEQSIQGCKRSLREWKDLIRLLEDMDRKIVANMTTKNGTIREVVVDGLFSALKGT